MEIVSKEALLARRFDTESGFEEDDVEVPGIGTVRVRGLSRAEVILLQSTKGGPAVMEQRTVAMGMVDPVMTEDDVKHWQRISDGSELDPVTKRIGQLSGMMPGADKEAYKSAGDESDAGVRALPGAEAGDDGEPSPDGDE